MHVRVCRECGEEYRPEIALCADCGGTLEDRYEDEAGSPSRGSSAAPTAHPPLDLSGHRGVFTTRQARDVVPLAEALRAAGLTFVIHESPADEMGHYATYSLLVRDSESERALEILAPLLAAEANSERPRGVDTAFRGEGGYERCPACDAALPPQAGECPDCGLHLTAESDPGEEA